MAQEFWLVSCSIIWQGLQQLRGGHNCYVVLCCVSQSVSSNSVIPWTIADQAPLSIGFSRQEYWNGLPFPSPGDLPDPGIEPRSTALQADALLSEPPGKTNKEFMCSKNKQRPLK